MLSLHHRLSESILSFCRWGMMSARICLPCKSSLCSRTSSRLLDWTSSCFHTVWLLPLQGYALSSRLHYRRYWYKRILSQTKMLLSSSRNFCFIHLYKGVDYLHFQQPSSAFSLHSFSVYTIDQILNQYTIQIVHCVEYPIFSEAT